MPTQMTERSDLAEQVARCRRLADINDQATVQKLLAMAGEYELRLDSISQKSSP